LNPDGGYVLVLTNANASPQTVNVRFGDFGTRVDLAADSVATLQWSV
jgi:hypothetical protein